MRRKQSEFDQIEVPGGGAMPRGSGGVMRTPERLDELKDMVEKSLMERGGFPTRGSAQMKKARSGISRAKQDEAPYKPFKFRKGGMVKGRDYAKGKC